MAYHRIRTLAKYHEITLVTMYEDKRDLEGIAELEKYCAQIHCVRHTRWDGIRNMLLRGVFSQLPFQVLYYESIALKKHLANVSLGKPFDLVHGVMLRMAPYLDAFPAPRVLDLNDSMVLNFSRQVKILRGLRKWFYQLELSRLRKYEAQVSLFAEKVIVVSELDRSLIAAHQVEVVPLGVDEPEVSFTPISTEGPIIAFSGNMNYGPNQDAVRWFLNHCWARVRQQWPEAQFWIIGKYANPSDVDFGKHKGCRVWGFVPDMMAVLRQAHMAVAPMQTGSGMQFKILEAMACSLPVVASKLGLGSIHAIPGEEVMIADDPDSMVEILGRVWADSQYRACLGRNALAFVKRHHSWEAIGDQVNGIYNDLVAGVKSSPTSGRA